MDSATPGAVLAELVGVPVLAALLLYGGGLQLLELPVKDVDLDRRAILVRGGKGRKDRVTVLPSAAVVPLQAHLVRVRRLHAGDCAAGNGRVALPGALARKLPAAAGTWAWQWVSPAARQYREPATGERRRHHLHPTVLQRLVSEAARRAGLTERVSCRAFRHWFATHLLDDGRDIRAAQELLGHADVRTTMIYTHVLNRGGRGVRSAADMPRRGAARPHESLGASRARLRRLRTPALARPHGRWRKCLARASFEPPSGRRAAHVRLRGSDLGSST